MAVSRSSGVNFLLLVELIVVVIVASAFLFYWNRLLGSTVAFLVRLATWRSHSAYISIHSLQISPLAGRISFREVYYCSSNVSIRALHGHITWRYWLFRVRHEADTESSNPKRNKLPCRIDVFAEGVEMFVYNRTPAYDAIVERMKKHEQEQAACGDPLSQQKSTASTARESLRFGTRLRRPAKSATSETLKDDSSNSSQPVGDNEQPATPTQPPKTGTNWLREAFPVELHVATGSVVLGSDATPYVLIGDFQRADGTMEITNSRSVCDDYKMIANIVFSRPTVMLRTNVDYSGPLLAHGKKAYDELYRVEPEIAEQPPSALSSFLGFHALSKRFAFLRDPRFSSPPVFGQQQDRIWKGLARYREGPSDKPRLKEELEYAKVTTLVKAEKLELTYYADTPGPVPHPCQVAHVDDKDEFGNVDFPPEYGIDMVIHTGRDGHVTYGPWADRQRDALQKTFAPSIFFNTEPRPRLKPGELRVHTLMIVSISFNDETTMRIATREPSKDWAHEHDGPEDLRKYGWMDVKVGANSSISYTQSQCPTERGYDSCLVLNLDTLEISTSVNYNSFLRSKSCKVMMTMPTPLGWNQLRDWGLDVTLDGADVYLLRDHVQIISDVARDWSSGAVGDFLHFVPNHYNFRVTLLNYAIHLCLNDYNIVDLPHSRSASAFMDVAGPRLEAFIAVASARYRPEFSTVPFSVNLKDAVIKVSVPTWDTHRSFFDAASAEKGILEVGKVGELSAGGSYTYYSIPHKDHQETLVLHLEGKRVAFKCLGWVLRRLFCVKDNYFGNFTQFTTWTEFSEKFDHDPNSVGDPVEQKYRPGRSDAFAVHVTMNVEESLILLSDEIYSCERGLALPVPQLQMSLKSTEHFMELSLDAVPTYIVPTDHFETTYLLNVAPPIRTKESVFIEGIEVKAIRLMGPRPHAATYLCLWEIDIPKISAFVTPSFFDTIKSAVSAVVYNFEDVENAPASFFVPKSDPDVTFVKLGIDSVVATYFENRSVLSVELNEGVNVNVSTLATKTYSSSLGVVIPSIQVNTFDRDDHRRLSNGVLRTGLYLDKYSAPTGWEKLAAEQKEFIMKEDTETKRIWYMYSDTGPDTDGEFVHGVYLPRPRYKDPAISVPDDTTTTSNTATDESSASEDSAPEDPALLDRIPRRRRPTRSLSAAGASPPNDSLGDESDSVSEASDSSTSGDDEAACVVKGYMAEALAARLRHFHLVVNKGSPLFPEWLEPSETDNVPPLQKQFKHGQWVKVIFKHVDVEMGPDTVRCALAIANSMSSLYIRPELQLDRLMIHQTEVIMGNGKLKDPTLLDVQAKQVRIRVNTHIDATRVDMIDVILGGASSSLEITPARGDVPEAKDLVVGLQHMVVTVLAETKTDLSLAELDLSTLTPGPAAPVASLRLEGVRAAMETSVDNHLRVQARLVNVQAVTAAAACITLITRRWIAFVDTLPSAPPSPLPFAELLYRIVDRAIDTAITVTSPAFFFEGSYQLHANDARSIRRDIGWLALSRLRHWLRQSDIDAAHPPSDSAALNDYILSKLIELEDSFGGDRVLLARQPFMKKALVSSGAGASPVSGKQGEGVLVSVETLSLHHHGRSVESSAVLTSEVKITSASVGLEKSVRLQDGRDVDLVRAITTVKSIEVQVQDSVLPAVETLLTLADLSQAKSTTLVNTLPSQSATVIVMDLQLHRVQLSALAGGGVLLRTSAQQLNVSSTRREARRDAITSSHNTVTLACQGIDVAQLQLVEEQGAAQDSQQERVVAILKISGVRAYVDAKLSGSKDVPDVIAVTFGTESIDFDSRPQLRAFLAFATSWHKQHLGNYRPVINQIRSLIPANRSPPTTPVEKLGAEPDITIDVAIGAIHLQVRAAKAVWVRWDVGKVYLTRSGAQPEVNFGVRLAPQTVGAYTTLKRNIKERDAPAINLPTVTAIGAFKAQDGRPYVSANITLGLFVGVLKPAVLDRLLSLHQRLGADIIHMVEEYREAVETEIRTRHNEIRTRHAKRIQAVEEKEKARTKAAKVDEAPKSPLVDLRISVEGVRVGLRADDVPTTLLFEALALQGHVSNTAGAAVAWRARVNHLGLSLGHLSSEDIANKAGPMSKTRSAYMVFDADVEEAHDQQQASRLSVTLNRVHTVMHIAALSGLSDLVRSWRADLHELRESRATEVAEIKSTTKRVFKKLDPADKAVPPEESWFAKRLFTVHVNGLGIAIPLDEAASVDQQHRENATVPALLFSTRVISFQNRRNETARFQIQQMSLQFLEKFDQGTPEHFMGDFHSGPNRMLLPHLDSQALMSSVPDTWTLSAHFIASDFELSLAPDIVEGVYKLIDLYDSGKDRFVDLERQYRAEMALREALEAQEHSSEDKPTCSPAPPSQRIDIRLSATFKSGIVELRKTAVHVGPKPTLQKGKTAKLDTFALPAISVWMDYKGVVKSSAERQGQPGTLVFNSAVHESRNTLRPSILPFFVELANRRERRRRAPRKTRRNTTGLATPPPDTPAHAMPLEARPPSSGAVLRTRFTLRIDQSQLRLSCSPDSDAYVDLKWASGGFIASTTLGSSDEISTFAGSISGVTISLSHEFAEQGRSCVEAGAKDLAFTVTLCPGREGVGRATSVVLDTQLSGQFRLDAFSAWLIFTSVWIDNVPKLDVQLRNALSESKESISTEVANELEAITASPAEHNRPKLGVVALVRFRTVDFDANIAISRAKLEISPIVLHTVTNGDRTEVELRVGKTQIMAKGDISGEITSNSLTFNTKRMSSRASNSLEPTVLSMSIHAGDLRGNIFHGDISICRFHLEPAVVTLADDWSALRDESAESEVMLEFVVTAGVFSGVARLLAIPRLLGDLYSVLDMVDSQKRIATQRSEAFKANQVRKRTGPSPVAAAILQTAHRASRGVNATAAASHIRTAQRMRFDLGGIDFGVFNEDHESGGHVADFYRFMVGKLEADLQRHSTRDGIPVREIKLLVSLLQWQTTDGERVAAKEKKEMSPEELLQSAWKQGHKAIAVLPSMWMTMSSKEYPHPPVLDFDFDLFWGETDGDIGFLPNFFEQAVSAFRKLIRGIDEQQLARLRRTDPTLVSPKKMDQDKKAESPTGELDTLAGVLGGQTLEYRPRDPRWADDPPIPKLKQLGESTGEAARFIPRIKSATKQLPVLIHRFGTLPLEEGMDLLLKLYEKQLPD